MVVPMKAIKKIQKHGNIQPIKHDFSWHIIYKQHVANLTIRILENKCSYFYKNLACQVYLARNADFASKIPNQTL